MIYEEEPAIKWKIGNSSDFKDSCIAEVAKYHGNVTEEMDIEILEDFQMELDPLNKFLFPFFTTRRGF